MVKTFVDLPIKEEGAIELVQLTRFIELILYESQRRAFSIPSQPDDDNPPPPRPQGIMLCEYYNKYLKEPKLVDRMDITMFLDMYEPRAMEIIRAFLV